MKPLIKYTLLLLLVFFLGYQSVYFKKLSTMKLAGKEKFDANQFALKLWQEKLPKQLDSAIEYSAFIQAVAANQDAAFAKYAHAMAMGNYRYSLIKVVGKVAVINENEILLELQHADSTVHLVLATEFIYGNAIRDASGLIDVKDIPNSNDLNTISESLNKMVRESVLPPFKKRVKLGDQIEVVAAVEINKAYIKFNELELIPVRIKFLP